MPVRRVVVSNPLDNQIGILLTVDTTDDGTAMDSGTPSDLSISGYMDDLSDLLATAALIFVENLMSDYTKTSSTHSEDFR